MKIRLRGALAVWVACSAGAAMGAPAALPPIPERLREVLPPLELPAPATKRVQTSKTVAPAGKSAPPAPTNRSGGDGRACDLELKGAPSEPIDPSSTTIQISFKGDPSCLTAVSSSSDWVEVFMHRAQRTVELQVVENKGTAREAKLYFVTAKSGLEVSLRQKPARVEAPASPREQSAGEVLTGGSDTAPAIRAQLPQSETATSIPATTTASETRAGEPKVDGAETSIDSAPPSLTTVGEAAPAVTSLGETDSSVALNPAGTALEARTSSVPKAETPTIVPAGNPAESASIREAPELEVPQNKGAVEHAPTTAEPVESNGTDQVSPSATTAHEALKAAASVENAPSGSPSIRVPPAAGPGADYEELLDENE